MYGTRHVRQIVFHKHNVGGLYRYSGAAADSYAYVRLHKRGTVVYSVPHHNNLFAGISQFGYYALLVGGHDFRFHTVYADLVSDCLRGNGIVARQHNHLYSALFKSLNSFFACGFDLVSHGNQSEKFASAGKIHDRLAFACQFLRGNRRRRNVDIAFSHKFCVACQSLTTLDCCFHAQSVEIFEIFRADGTDILHIRVLGYCDRQRMLTVFFKRGGKRNKLALARSVRRNNVRDRRLPLGHCARFVKHHCRNIVQLFQSFRALD